MLKVLTCVFIKFFAWSEDRWVPESKDSLRVGAGLSTPGLDFSLLAPGPDALFVPNVSASPYLLFSYQHFGLSFRLPIENDETVLSKKGRTKASDYQFRFYGHRNSHEFVYQKFTGYSLEEWIDPSNNPVIRPDLRSEIFYYNFITSTSPGNYSQAVSFDQKGYQDRFGSGLLFFGTVGRQSFSGKETFLPSFVVLGRSQLSDATEVDSIYGILGLGYGLHAPLLAKIYFSSALFFGTGLSFQNVNTSTGKRNSNEAMRRAGARLSLGYNDVRHSAGLQLVVESNTISILDGEMSQSTFETKMFYAFRFEGVSIPQLDRLDDLLSN